jgi:hypothetical protein
MEAEFPCFKKPNWKKHILHGNCAGQGKAQAEPKNKYWDMTHNLPWNED